MNISFFAEITGMWGIVLHVHPLVPPKIKTREMTHHFGCFGHYKHAWQCTRKPCVSRSITIDFNDSWDANKSINRLSQLLIFWSGYPRFSYALLVSVFPVLSEQCWQKGNELHNHKTGQSRKKPIQCKAKPRLTPVKTFLGNDMEWWNLSNSVQIDLLPLSMSCWS